MNIISLTNMKNGSRRLHPPSGKQPLEKITPENTYLEYIPREPPPPLPRGK